VLQPDEVAGVFADIVSAAEIARGARLVEARVAAHIAGRPRLIQARIGHGSDLSRRPAIADVAYGAWLVESRIAAHIAGRPRLVQTRVDADTAAITRRPRLVAPAIALGFER
jgi:hypothetical protein